MTRGRDVRGVLKTHFHAKCARACVCFSLVRVGDVRAPVSDSEKGTEVNVCACVCARVLVGWGARTRVRVHFGGRCARTRFVCVSSVHNERCTNVSASTND